MYHEGPRGFPFTKFVFLHQRLPVGSSAKTIFGLLTRALAIAIRCCSPARKLIRFDGSWLLMLDACVWTCCVQKYFCLSESFCFVEVSC